MENVQIKDKYIIELEKENKQLRIELLDIRFKATKKISSIER
jgi:hypothetical protein